MNHNVEMKCALIQFISILTLEAPVFWNRFVLLHYSSTPYLYTLVSEVYKIASAKRQDCLRTWNWHLLNNMFNLFFVVATLYISKTTRHLFKISSISTFTNLQESWAFWRSMIVEVIIMLVKFLAIFDTLFWYKKINIYIYILYRHLFIECLVKVSLSCQLLLFLWISETFSESHLFHSVPHSVPNISF